MVIRAVAFDIGGVLEITPDLGVDRLWETRLGLPAGEILVRMRDVRRGGSVGTITLGDVHEALRDRLGLDDQTLAQYMADLWREYLGTANTELIEYTRRLRLRYRTGIVSNSFVGAREREQAAYGFEDLVEEIVYSHEVGFSKPDPRIYALRGIQLTGLG
jgi:putative hydrolase of the HAD superfamily